MSKYNRNIRSVDVPETVITVDVYSVLVAFDVTHPAIQHAIKKLLLPGQRGAKDYLTDLREARDALDRAIRDEGQT